MKAETYPSKILKEIYCDANNDCVIKVDGFMHWNKTNAKSNDLTAISKNRHKRNNQKKKQSRYIGLERITNHNHDQQYAEKAPKMSSFIFYPII